MSTIKKLTNSIKAYATAKPEDYEKVAKTKPEGAASNIENDFDSNELEMADVGLDSVTNNVINIAAFRMYLIDV